MYYIYIAIYDLIGMAEFVLENNYFEFDSKVWIRMYTAIQVL